jgi:hypothetical protein
MFHYKLKMLARVCRKLRQDHQGQDVKGLLNDVQWIEVEFDRLETIMQHVEGLMLDDRHAASSSTAKLLLPEHAIWSDEDESSGRRQSRLEEFGTRGGRRRSRGYNPYSDDEGADGEGGGGDDEEDEEDEFGL